jgi:hypothetical protein
VENVQLVGSNKITGRFAANLKEFYGPSNGRLIEHFLNWKTDLESILRFTSKYGPLRNKPVGGAEFEVSWFDWKLDQRRLQNLWERRRVFEFSEPESSGGSLVLGKDWLTYRALNLFVFLSMDLATCESKRLRKCKHPDCPNPHFIATHLKQKFCSEPCAAWGQKELKKQWWAKNGPEWRAEQRLTKSEGGKNVTQKTR